MKRRDVVLSSLAFGTLPATVRANTGPGWKTTDSRLREAIAVQVGVGGEVLLAGGDYGMLHINSAFPEKTPLVLKGLDPEDPPRFSALDIYEAANVSLDNLVFDYTFKLGDEYYHYPFRAWRSKNIAFLNCLFDGDVARGISSANDGFPSGWGPFIRDGSGFRMENCELRGFLRGMLVGQTSDVQVIGNRIHGMRSEGMNFSEITNGVIAKNTIHRFNLSKESNDHPDMIQFWTENTSNPSRNIEIRDNLLFIGNENRTQSIFMRNELVDTGRAGSEMFYQDLLIENNVILNSHLHGITVGEASGLDILNNTLVRDPAGSGTDFENILYQPRINVKPVSRDVAILRNVVASVSGHEGQADWRVDDNLIVQDIGRLRPNFYEAVFVGNDWSDPSAYAPRPGGPLDGTGIGAQVR